MEVLTTKNIRKAISLYSFSQKLWERGSMKFSTVKVYIEEDCRRLKKMVELQAMGDH